MNSIFFKMEPDGNCLFNAILQQASHDPVLYTPDHLHHQTAYHMLKNANLFYEYVAQELIDGDESYESYVTNIFNGKIWGDDLMASAVSHMWNIPISVVSPELNTIHLFHDTTPKIVIMANGDNAYSGRKQMTHFSQTRSILHGYQLPSAGVAKNPKVWDDFEKGKKKSFGHFLHSEKESTLTKMRNVRENVNVLDRKIRNLYAEAEHIKNMKKDVD